MNGWKIQVEADNAYNFLMGLIESGKCHYDKLFPLIR